MDIEYNVSDEDTCMGRGKYVMMKKENSSNSCVVSIKTSNNSPFTVMTFNQGDILSRDTLPQASFGEEIYYWVLFGDNGITRFGGEGQPASITVSGSKMFLIAVKSYNIDTAYITVDNPSASVYKVETPVDGKYKLTAGTYIIKDGDKMKTITVTPEEVSLGQGKTVSVDE